MKTDNGSEKENKTGKEKNETILFLILLLFVVGALIVYRLMDSLVYPSLIIGAGIILILALGMSRKKEAVVKEKKDTSGSNRLKGGSREKQLSSFLKRILSFAYSGEDFLSSFKTCVSEMVPSELKTCLSNAYRETYVPESEGGENALTIIGQERLEIRIRGEKNTYEALAFEVFEKGLCQGRLLRKDINALEEISSGLNKRKKEFNFEAFSLGILSLAFVLLLAYALYLEVGGI